LRALVISGGSVKSAYSSGAITHLLGDLEIQYPIVSGISAGAICGAFISQFPLGQEKQASKELSDMWLSLKGSDIFKLWSLMKRLQSIWSLGFYDSSPLHALVKKNVSLDKIRQANRNVSAGCVNIYSGKYTTFDQTDDNFISAVIASASIPGIFRPVEINGSLFVDGGIKSMSPILTAIQRGATIIDLIITSPEIRINKFIENPNIIEVMKRSLDLATDKLMHYEIESVLMHNKLVRAGAEPDKKEIKLNIIRPKHNLIEDLLDFNPEKIRAMMNIGYLDAKEKFENLKIL
jgi:NTE family protein